MTRKVFYEKRGRRYVPVCEYNHELINALPTGAHLVMTYPGGRTTRSNVDPNYAALIAAGRVAERAMCDAISKCSEMRPPRTPITQQQRDAWEHLIKVFGEEARSLSTSSAHDVAQSGLRALQEEADRLMKHESVRNAYEQFLMVAELTKKEKA